MEPQTIPTFVPEHEVPAPQKKMGKIKASKMLVQESWAILMQDKEILWFPVLSMIASLIALACMSAFMFFFVFGGDSNAFEEEGKSWGVFEYGMLIVFHTIMFFIIHFFQAGVYIIAHARMNGGDLTFSEGMSGAWNASGKILAWSLISATVGVVLRAIAERSKLAGKIVVSLLGAGWSILTYFSLPALVIGNASVIDSFKVSAQTIRKTWGETLIITIGTGLFLGLIFLAGFAVAITIVIIAQSFIVFIAVGVLLAVFLLGIIVLSSAFEAIFKIALFEYARNGVVPKGFSQELIQQAVKQ